MSRLPSRRRPWLAWAAMAFGACLQIGHAAAPAEDAPTRLDQAEALRTKDHPEFVRRLEAFHREASQLSPGERQHLRYLDAWRGVK